MELLEKAAVEDYQYTVTTTVGTSRRQVCVAFCKRLVAFLLSTVGLSIVTVFYSLGGGALFQALESPHETRVKSRVNDSINWHVSTMWNITSELNVLYVVMPPFTFTYLLTRL